MHPGQRLIDLNQISFIQTSNGSPLVRNDFDHAIAGKNSERLANGAAADHAERLRMENE